MSREVLEKAIHRDVGDALLSVEQGDLQRLRLGELEELAELSNRLSSRLNELLGMHHCCADRTSDSA